MTDLKDLPEALTDSDLDGVRGAGKGADGPPYLDANGDNFVYDSQGNFAEGVKNERRSGLKPSPNHGTPDLSYPN